ncbi:hypothetical protein C0995_003552 [Termitomyces sp. Mi166|nr:hypothetical protein C0995_003552 [Termitomyces sp. Mi166\
MTPYEAELYWEFERQKRRAYIASLPSSSFEITKFEEDESFYATFPEARHAAINLWVVEHYPFAPWAQSPVAIHQDSIGLTYDLSLASSSPSSHVPAPTVNFTTYTLGDALNLPSSSSSHVPKAKAPPKAPTPPQAYPVPAVHYDYSGDSIGYDPHNGPNSVLMADKTLFGNKEHSRVDHEAFSVVPGTPSYDNDDVVLRALHLLAPARRSSKKTRRLHVHSTPASRNQKNIYPSTSPTSSISTLDTPPSSPTFSQSLSSQPTIVPSSAPRVIYTGNWETDAMATEEYVHLASNTKNPTISIPASALPLLPIKPHLAAGPSLPRRHRQAPRQRPHPYSLPPRRSSSRECSTSGSLPNKRPKVNRDKNGKPIMACLFCRGRKIACGPPPKGSNDPTCNQCARRGLECEYPSINRRGMRKNPILRAHNNVSKAPSPRQLLSPTPELVQ